MSELENPLKPRVRSGRDRMVVEFSPSIAISAYHY
jgi:hypothetical protein